MPRAACIQMQWPEVSRYSVRIQSYRGVSNAPRASAQKTQSTCSTSRRALAAQDAGHLKTSHSWCALSDRECLTKHPAPQRQRHRAKTQSKETEDLKQKTHGTFKTSDSPVRACVHVRVCGLRRGAASEWSWAYRMMQARFT